MGCSYAAYTVIGCVLNRDALYAEVEVIKKDHDCPTFITFTRQLGDYPQVCPDCGEKIRTMEARCSVDNAEESLEEWMDNWDTGNLKDPRIVSDGMNGNEWIGLLVVACEEDGSGGGTSYLSTINIREHKKQLQGRLEPLGLWDEESFGIHTILYISC